MCAIVQSLDPEIDAQIKARYRNKFKLDSDKETNQQQVMSVVLQFLLRQFVIPGCPLVVESHGI